MTNRVPAYEGKGKYIFVSYSHKDSGIVYPTIRKMFEEKYRVWYDEGIAPGSEWPHNIEVHLKQCSVALICVSANSLASKNCDNEVVNALNNNKQIIQCSLDGNIHPLLKDAPVIRSEEELFKALNPELIGDGTGYDLALNNRRRFSIWNLLLGLAIVLIIALGSAMYGIEKGYFDEYLPGRNTDVQDITVKEEKIGLEVNNDIIAQAILEQLSEEDLFRDIEFIEGADDWYMRMALGLEDYDKPLQYYDLTQSNIEEADLQYCSEDCLKLLKYLPSLKVLRLNSDKIKSLEALDECPRLEKVYLNVGSFPIELNENRRYTVLIQK